MATHQSTPLQIRHHGVKREEVAPLAPYQLTSPRIMLPVQILGELASGAQGTLFKLLISYFGQYCSLDTVQRMGSTHDSKQRGPLKRSLTRDRVAKRRLVSPPDGPPFFLPSELDLVKTGTLLGAAVSCNGN